MKILTIALSFFLIGTCEKQAHFNQNEVNVICGAIGKAYNEGHFEKLTEDIEKVFGVSSERIRIAKKGIYVSTNQWFVQEKGYFISKTVIKINGQGTDPSYEHIVGCIYKYEIKG